MSEKRNCTILSLLAGRQTLNHEIFSTAIFPFPLIHEEQLSITWAKEWTLSTSKPLKRSKLAQECVGNNFCVPWTYSNKTHLLCLVMVSIFAPVLFLGRYQRFFHENTSFIVYGETTQSDSITVNSQDTKSLQTSFCSYARPAQTGPIRTRLCRPCIAAIPGD